MYGFTRSIARTIPAATTADPASSGTPVRRMLSPEQPGRPHGEHREQEAERHRERPGGAEERGHQALGYPEDDGGDERPADAAHAAQHRDGEHAPDVVAIGG